MDVNRSAPLFVGREIDIFAPPEMVWDWLSRVELWPDWHPDISNSRWLDAPGINAAFKWRLRKVVSITARVETWDECREFGWTGNVWSSTLRQVFWIDGDFRRTRIAAEGSLEGPGCGFSPLRAVAGGQLARTNELWLGALKTRLESEKLRGRPMDAGVPGPKLPPQLPSQRPGLRR